MSDGKRDAVRVDTAESVCCSEADLRQTKLGAAVVLPPGRLSS